MFPIIIKIQSPSINNDVINVWLKLFLSILKLALNFNGASMSSCFTNLDIIIGDEIIKYKLNIISCKKAI